MKMLLNNTLKICIVAFILAGCNQKTNSDNKANATNDTINEPGRLLPRKLRNIPFGINAAHFPNPCYADFKNNKYVWKHNTTVSVTQNLQLVEYGSFVFTKKGWYLRVTYTAKDFDEHYGTKNGQLQSGVVYTDPTSWRMSDSLYAGDAMWYYIAKDSYGNLFKGIAPIETEGQLLKDVEDSKGFSKFNLADCKLNWTGYGEVGGYSLSGELKLQSGLYAISNDSLKNVELVFDMSTISHKDKNLVQHLTGADFFDCAKYPTAKFSLSEPTLLSSKSKTIKGLLTIKGITLPITVPISSTETNGIKTFVGKISFDRTQYNIKYNSKSFFSNLGDKAIKNTIDFEFTISTLKK